MTKTQHCSRVTGPRAIRLVEAWGRFGNGAGNADPLTPDEAREKVRAPRSPGQEGGQAGTCQVEAAQAAKVGKVLKAALAEVRAVVAATSVRASPRHLIPGWLW